MTERLQRRQKHLVYNLMVTDDRRSDVGDVINPIQDRMMRRRRSRNNLFDDTETEGKLQEVPSHVKRSRTKKDAGEG